MSFAASPTSGASGEALAEAQPLTAVAAQRVRELFESAVAWVGARLNDAERRDDSVRVTPALREDPSWERHQRRRRERGDGAGCARWRSAQSRWRLA